MGYGSGVEEAVGEAALYRHRLSLGHQGTVLAAAVGLDERRPLPSATMNLLPTISATSPLTYGASE